jgi:DMSO/TMAO reductase YedYZ molybdopterin-dependent catalytic subunit
MDDDDFDPAKWRLRVKGLADDSDDTDDTDQDASSDDVAGNSQITRGEASISIADIMILPRAEMVTELKCIEGWSVPVHWAGARFADFAERYKPATRDGSATDVLNKPEALVPYVSLETPDSDYYVGLDMESALHPQTLLCYEMNGEPLSLEHGAPLRLVIPVKYGIKNIKRIGTIHFTSRRPADYWAERGYDWYAGH